MTMTAFITTLPAAAAYTIAVTDKAGNSTTATVTMKPIGEAVAATEALSIGNDTSANKQAT